MSASTLRIGPAGPLAGQTSASDGSESAASILRSALLTHFGSTSSSSNDAIAIDNKYFTASVALADLNLADADAAAEGKDAKEDGVLLVNKLTSTKWRAHRRGKKDEGERCGRCSYGHAGKYGFRR